MNLIDILMLLLDVIDIALYVYENRQIVLLFFEKVRSVVKKIIR